MKLSEKKTRKTKPNSSQHYMYSSSKLKSRGILSSYPKPMVYYHHMCSDGIAGAWCAWKYFNTIMPANIAEEIEYKGIQPEKQFTITADHMGRDIYFIDVLGTRNLIELCKVAKHVIIIDHHKTNKEFFDSMKKKPANLKIIYDESRSACQIAWDYFNNNTEDQSRPWFINYIADRDLWNWQLADSKPINIGLYNLGYIQSIEAVNKLYIKSGTDLMHIINTVKGYGIVIEKYHLGLLEKIASSATEVLLRPPGNIGKFRCWISSIHGELASDLGNMLAVKPLKNGDMPGFGATYTFDFRTGNWNVSLRSVEGGQDVSLIAKQFGGGGHARASAFVIKYPATLKKYFIY